MKYIIGKILVILTLLKNVIIRKNKYTLHFKYKFDGFKRWFYDWDVDHKFKWAFDENNLEIQVFIFVKRPLHDLSASLL